jgi:hypothetical protein
VQKTPAPASYSSLSIEERGGMCASPMWRLFFAVVSGNGVAYSS